MNLRPVASDGTMQLDRPARSSKKLIGLTPLIDVVFILLLFFMLTSSFIQWQSLDLMVASGNRGEASDEPPLMLGVRGDGTVFLANEPLSNLEDDRLHELLAPRDRDVTLTPSDATSIQQVVTLLERVETLGARSVSVNTRPLP